MQIRGNAFLVIGLLTALPSMGVAQEATINRLGLEASGQPSTVRKPSLNFYGSSGLIDLPSGEAQPDGEFSLTTSYFGAALRNTINYQITNRLSGSFRYSIIPDFNVDVDQFDRSFDVRFKLFDEGRFLPATTIGLRDLGGTGIYGGEYIAATKNVNRNLKVTAGLGWGRLGSNNGFSNPLGLLNGGFDTRPGTDVGRGGVPDFGRWFRGDAALFGGLEWYTPVKGLSFKAEYSSDAYDPEIRGRIDGPGSARRNIFNRNSSVNLGLEYQVSDDIQLGAYYLYGSEFGLRASISLNPNRSLTPGSYEGGPLPVLVRPELKLAEQEYSKEWVKQTNVNSILRTNIQNLFNLAGLQLESLQINGDKAEIRLRNNRYDAEAQAIGRAARVLTRALPPSVEVFVITPVVQGLPVASVTFSRSDIEEQEHHPSGAENLLALAKIENLHTRVPEGTEFFEGLYPKFNWSLGPFLKTGFFDPDSPVRVQTGIRARARIDVKPGLFFSGAVTTRIAGNLNSITRESDSVLPRVRSNAALFFQQGEQTLERLTVDYLMKYSPEIYGRVSAGYLESMFGGISSEVLWKPIDKKYAFGAELNYAQQRNFNQLLGFQDYSVLTGHVSAYYKADNGFSYQVDAGRYLARDWGATFTMNREFNNGWRVGGFFTLTDVPFDDFGEGSFDKGIIITIPIAWALGKPLRKSSDLVLRPLTRDGGARLNVENRLYPIVEDYDRKSLENSWGKVWR